MEKTVGVLTFPRVSAWKALCMESLEIFDRSFSFILLGTNYKDLISFHLSLPQALWVPSRGRAQGCDVPGFYKMPTTGFSERISEMCFQVSLLPSHSAPKKEFSGFRGQEK